MDRYHLAWLMVGKPKDIVRGRPMTPEEEAAYVREVAEAKTSALRMSLDAVERQGMPFVGEERGMAPGQGMGAVPGDPPGRDRAARDDARRRWGAARSGPRPDRPRLPAPLPPARPDGPGPRRRLLRPGRPEGGRRPGAAPCAGLARRRRRDPPRPARCRGRRARPPRLAGRPADGPRDPGSRPGRRRRALRRADPALLRFRAGSPGRGPVRGCGGRHRPAAARAGAAARSPRRLGRRPGRPTGAGARRPRLAGRGRP